MSVTTSPTSKVVINDPSIPDGLQIVGLDLADTGDQLFRKKPLAFKDGLTEVEIPFAPTTRVVGYQIDNGWPPRMGSVLVSETQGSLELFANETWRTQSNFFRDASQFKSINGVEGPIGDNIVLPSGGLVNVSSDGTLTYSPRNAFNHLAEGEMAVERISYTTENSTWEDDCWTNELVAPHDGGDIVFGADGWMSIAYDYEGNKITEYPSDLMYALGDNFKTGETYQLSWEVDEIPVEGGYNGSIEFYWYDENKEEIGLVESGWPRIRPDKEREGLQTGIIIIENVPANAKYLYLKTPNGTRFQLRMSESTMIREIPAETKYFEIQIKGSEDVGPELNNGLTWAGAGWSEGESVFTHTAGSTNALEATVSGLTVGHIYQFSLVSQNATAGTVKMALGANEQEWEIETNQPDVVMLRASAETETLRIIPSSDFDGEVTDVSFKWIKKHGDSAASLDFIKGFGGTGEARLEWKIPTVAKFTDTLTPQKEHTGVLNYSDEFGVRENDVIESMWVHDATSVAKRGGVSIKGGDWFQADNVMVTGGYPESESGWKFQVGFVLCDNGKPTMKAQQFNHCYVDLLMAPMTDNYTTQNSDGFVVNGGNDRFDSRLYMYDCAADGIPDACVDQKIVGFINQMGAYGGHRSIRAHSSTHTLAINTLTTEQEGTESAYHIAYASGRVNVYNCWYENQDGLHRIHSVGQMRSLNDPRGAFSEGTAVATNELAQGGLNSFCALRNYPRYPDFIRVHMTDMEFEVSSDGGTTWSTLELPFTSEQGVIAENRRTFSIAAGTYSFRARCKNHNEIGEWSQVDNVVVV